MLGKLVLYCASYPNLKKKSNYGFIPGQPDIEFLQ